MKPAQRTIYYTCYPPNYKPGDGYKSAKNLQDARKILWKLGDGSEVDRSITLSNKRRMSLANHMATFVYKSVE